MVTLFIVIFHVLICLYSRYAFLVHMYLIWRHLALLYVLAGCIWQPCILMSRSWSLDHGDLSVADQSAQRILSWWSECSRSSDTAVALPPSFSPVWLSRSLLLLVSISQLLLCISLHVLCFYIFWWCNIPVILYYSLWWPCTCTILYWNVYCHCASASDSYLYWCLAYIREGISDLRIYVTVTSPYPRDRGATLIKVNVVRNTRYSCVRSNNI